MEDAEGEAILRALAGESEPFVPPVIRRNPWDQRLRRNIGWRPFPYLFHNWQVTFGDRPLDYVTSGRRRYVSNWVNTCYRQDSHEWFEDRRNWFTSHGPFYAAVPWLVHTDCDKAHRCPVCGSSGGWLDQMEKTGGYIKGWHVYTCERCGQRASLRFYLREHPCDRCSTFSHLRYRPRRMRRNLDYWWFEQRRKLRR